MSKTNGTRGFLTQISRKSMIDKKLVLFLNENKLKNKPLEKLISSLKQGFNIEEKIDFMCNPYRDYLSFDELNVLNNYYKRDYEISDSFLISEKCSFQQKIFHSLKYSRRGLIDSYSICFKNENNLENFGKIVKFVEVKGKILAFIQVFQINNQYLDEFPTDNTLKDINYLLMKKLFSTYYHSFNEQEFSLKLIPVSKIVCHCLIVKADFNTLFTKLPYIFEHD